jgi:hypothetical protein
MVWTTNGQAGVTTQPIHTLYYRKETPASRYGAPRMELPKSPATTGIRLVQNTQPAEQAPPPRLQESYQPTKEQFFQLDSEACFTQRENQIRVREDAQLPQGQQRPVVIFPPHEGVVNEPFPGRYFQPAVEEIEPNYLVYGRLFFEDKNTERYGWSMGPLQPFMTAWKFVGDASNWPYKLFSFPRLNYDSNAGLCLPGDPVPMLMYPPAISFSGLIAQACYTCTLYAVIR